MVDCCFQHAVRRVILLFMVLVLSIAASRTGRKLHRHAMGLGPGSDAGAKADDGSDSTDAPDVGVASDMELALYIATITCELAWMAVMLLDGVLVDRLHRAFTWFGVGVGSLAVVLSLTELGVEYAGGMEDQVFHQVRYAIAYIGVGVIYGRHAYIRLRPPQPNANVIHIAGDPDAPAHTELMEIRLGG